MSRLLLALLLVAACGPSAAEIRAAREAHYTVPMSDVFAAVYDATSAKYDILDRDDIAGWLTTRSMWYAAEGGLEPKSADGDQFVRGGSTRFRMTVKVLGAENDWTVEITPEAWQLISGSPQPHQLAPDDPQMPGWVQGKVDDLYVAIHARLNQPPAK